MRIPSLVLLLSLCCLPYVAAQTSWQDGFGNPGPNADVSAIGADASSIYIAGYFTQVGGLTAQRVARWDRQGKYWEALGAGLPLETRIDEWAVEATGKVFARGDIVLEDGSDPVHLATWDGTAWLGTPGVHAVDLQTQGSTAFALGTLTRSDTTFSGLLQATASGWEPYLDSLPPGATLFTISNEGDLFVAGDFFPGTDSAATIARWQTDRWQFLNSVFEQNRSLSPSIFDLVAQNDTLFVAGFFDRVEGVEAAGLAYWHDGTWAQMGMQPPGYAYLLEATASGTLYTSGEEGVLHRWSGQAWDTLRAPLTKGTRTLAAVGDTLLMGMATAVPVSAGGFRARQEYLVGFNGTDWFRLGDNAQGLDDTVMATAEYQGRLYASGRFHFAGTQATRIAYWEDRRWHPVPGAFEREAEIRDLCFTDEGHLYAAGNFALYTETDTLTSLARWDGQAWHPLGEGLHRADQGRFNLAQALACDGNTVYVGGDFGEARQADGGAVAAAHVARWQNGRWEPLGAGTDDAVQVLYLEATTLYVGGTFAQAGGEAAAHIAAYDLNTEQWSALGEGPGGTVITLTVLDDVVYVGSGPWLPSLPPAYLVRAWDGQTWADLDPGIGMTIQSLAADRHGQVYAGGALIFINGDTTPALIRWDGNAWHEVDGGLQGRNGHVSTLRVYEDRLHIGGAFDSVGTSAVPSAHFAIWDIPENISTEERATLPAEAQVSVFPNPFREQAEMALTLPSAATVTVRLVDILGREVAQVATGPWRAGAYHIPLTAEGQNLAAGVYFCVVTINGRMQTLPLVRLGR